MAATLQLSESDSVETTDRLLEVKDLKVEFRIEDGVVRAVNGLSYGLSAGETVAILGESGSGKSVSAQAIMGIIDSPPGFITGGSVKFEGRELLTMGDEERRKIRGNDIGMVFQDALSALNPVYSVGWQIGEMFRMHRGMSRKEAKAESLRLMERVKIPDAAKRLRAYPFEFSGGMRQRIMIAMSIALDPKVLIADEPTTALDVTVQAQVMDLLAELQTDYGMGLILITHDLGVVAEVADRVIVMYAGRGVEKGTLKEVFGQPAHPYTEGLMRSVPRSDVRVDRLEPIIGNPPDLLRLPKGCAFQPRCPYEQEDCLVDEPPLVEVEPGDSDRATACLHWEDVYR